jgi:uncharacterized protein YndB with AHSA1/START domain
VKNKDDFIILNKRYQGSLEEIWELWTTREGVESWWGPEGFHVEVTHINAVPGGRMNYVMIAVATPIVQYLQKEGLSATTEHELHFLEVIPHSRIQFDSRIDFVPGIIPYTTITTVEFYGGGDFVDLTLTLQKMHDALWTQRAVDGWTSQLGKLVSSSGMKKRR